MPDIVLASASPIRGQLLRNAGVAFLAEPARVDEEMVRAALAAEGASPRDQADALAEMKAARVAARHSAAVVIGCDQVLALGGDVFAKPADPDAARAQLRALRGKEHRLFSAVVLYHEGRPVWRHLGEARMTMRMFTDAYLEEYLARNGESVGASVGAYQVEGEGLRLFSRIEGDYFTILGLPMLPLLGYLMQRGFVPG